MTGHGQDRRERLREMGQELRSRREDLGLTLEDVRARTRMNPRYLEAVENGEEEIIPGKTYYQAFLKTYAGFLGLDGSRYSREYRELDVDAEQTNIRGEAKSPSLSPTVEKPRHRRRRGSNRLTWALGSLIVLVFVGFALVRWFADPQDPPVDVPPTTGSAEPVQTLQPKDETIDEPEVKRIDPSPEETVFTVDTHPLVLRIYTVDGGESYSWLRVTVDGENVYENTIRENAELKFEAESTIVVRAGRPWAVYFEICGIDVGVGGAFGPVKDLTFKYVSQ